MNISTMPEIKQSLAEEAGSAFLWLIFSVGAEKLIFLLRLLILARLLVPEDFGLFAIGITVIGVMGRLTDIGLNPALIQNPNQQKNHLDTAWSISLLRGLGIALILFIAAPYVADLFSEPRATNIIRVLVLATLVRSAASIRIPAITRALHFRGLALLNISGAAANTAVSICLARSIGVWALVFGHVAGVVVHSLGTYIVAPYRPSFQLSGKAAGQLLRFGRWIFLTGILGVLADAILRWMISTRLGLAELGLFFMAARLAFLPAQVVRGIFGQVALPVFSRVHHNRYKLAESYRSVLLGMHVLLIPVSMIFIVLAPDLVEHVLGARWTGAIVVLQILVLTSMLGLLGDSSIPLLTGSGYPERVVVMGAARFLILTSLAWFMMGAFGLMGVGLSYLIATVFMQIVAVYLLHQLIAKPFSGLAGTFVALVVTAFTAALVAFVFSMAVSGSTGVLVAACTAMLVALIVGLILNRAFRFGLLSRFMEPFPTLVHMAGKIQRKVYSSRQERG
jgi:O-antigen/teichoic acid export membrane protein